MLGLISQLANQYWAIDSGYFENVYPHIMERLDRQESLEGLPVFAFAQRKRRWISQSSEELPQDEMLALYYLDENGKRQNGDTNPNDVREGSTAVISIVGPITKYGGLCSYGSKDYAQHIQLANDNDQVKEIVLMIDSPGGMVDGVDEVLNAIAARTKPVVSFVDGLCASLAYYIASQTDHIIVNSKNRSWVGSIGTLFTHVDRSGWLAKNGYVVKHLTAKESTKKMLGNSDEPLSEAAEAEITNRLNAVNGEFIRDVKKGRGDRLKDTEEVFTGAVFLGGDAVEKGLADEIGTFTYALQTSRAMVSSSTQISQTTISKESKKTMGLFKKPSADEIEALVEASAEKDTKIGQLNEKLLALQEQLMVAKEEAAQVAVLEQKVANLTEKVGQLEEENERLGNMDAAKPTKVKGGIEGSLNDDGEVDDAKDEDEDYGGSWSKYAQGFMD